MSLPDGAPPRTGDESPTPGGIGAGTKPLSGGNTEGGTANRGDNERQEDPPAAKTVIDGRRTEENSRLADEIREKDRKIKEREIRVSELEDENRRLKQGGLSTFTNTRGRPRAAKSAWTFFQEDDDGE